ncbi:MAG: cysteine--tRNA ligase [Acidimicrobiia bacterium]|nr:MAG: cysteine--tRNA ligase [Acidimicrobiia bacterium]
MDIYNTLARATVHLDVDSSEPIGMYVCGPTVQSEPHLGHGRSAVSFDVLRRYLIWQGHEVVFVRNVTDIDDKIIARAIERGMSTESVAAEAAVAFGSAYDLLGNLPASIEPKATDHIPEMIELIAKLIETDHAYASSGDVYFSVRSFPQYGVLSRHDLDDLRAGERVAIDERKRDPLDFAMWKAAKPGEPSWDSPWGRGRPGWHIECSVMATKYLGDSFAIHAGGSDLIFPHHENEIAQSEAATGKPFARYWMHNGMLNLTGEKMAKSTGHVVTLLDSLERWDPLAVRLFYLRTHYRKPLEFSENALDDAQSSLARLRAFRRRFPERLEASPDSVAIERFTAAMDNDLDAAGALGVLFELVREGNSLLDAGDSPDGLASAFDKIMEVLGLAELEDQPGSDRDIRKLAGQFGIEDGTIEDLLALRASSREREDWATSDALRDALAELNIVIEDTPDGARWHRS